MYTYTTPTITCTLTGIELYKLRRTQINVGGQSDRMGHLLFT